ncbi:MAG TPA: class I SAM-dependent methyltransferase [Polyangiales bacterium]|nr:class I SAM-dependent methyltransferase [Polyangiales bacterium]
MDKIVRDMLAEYEERSRRESELWSTLTPAEIGTRIEEFLICIGPQTGQVLHAITTAAKAKTFVEIGASYGYSTIWLADAARETGGKVHSLELSQSKVDHARAQLKRGGLDRYVEFHVGDALKTLEALPGPFDFVLVDLWKDLYVRCFEIFYPKLAPNAFVAADNIIFPPFPKEQAAYRQAVRAKPDMESMLLPIGSGVELSKKRAN